MFKKSVAAATLGATTLLWASPASAQDTEATDALQAVMDNLWLVIAGCLVFLMQAGFAFVEAGLTRAKNLANIMAKNLADMAIGVTMFFLVGYSIAFNGPGDGHWWGGLGNFAMLDDVDVLNDFGASGVGNYHGREGFKTFSHARGVFTEGRVNLAKLAGTLPPYSKKVEKMLAGQIKK